MSSQAEPAPPTYFRQGVLPILIASALWALVYFFRKTALYGISPPILIFANLLIAALGIWIICRISVRNAWQLFCSAPLRFFFLGLLGETVGTTLMTFGVGQLDLGVGLVLEKLQPIFTLILASWCLKERIYRNQIPWIFLSLISSYFVSAKNPWSIHLDQGNVLGICSIVGAAFSWGISSVLGRSLVQLNSDFRTLTFLRLAIGTVTLAPVVFFSGFFQLQFQPDAYIATVVVLSALVGRVRQPSSIG